ncbi:MAG: ABC transporter ATP-binding protein [Defluviicoccus sp.]|nr:ABC transporter ATP-binding protein [Defluviicoccus sp.]
MRGYFVPVLGALICMAVVAAATAGTAWLLEPALDEIFGAHDREMLYLVPVAILALALIGGGAFYLQAVLVAWVEERVVADFRRDMYVRLMGADLGFFVNTQTGNLIARFTSDAAVLRRSLLRAMTGAIRHGLKLAALVGVMVYQEWLLALIAVVVFPLASWPIVSIGRRIRRAAAIMQARIADLTVRLDESFPAARLIKAFRMERAEIARADTAIEQVFKRSYRAARIAAITRPVMEALSGVMVAVVILVGGSMVIAGSMTTGEFSSFLGALLLSYQPVKALAGLNNVLQEGLAAAQRVFAVLDIEPDIVDAPDARTLTIEGGEIRFDKVSFSYTPDIRALVDVDIRAPAGATVALVGPSGAGKSTLLNLIPRFYDVDEGTISVDGRDIRQVTLASLRDSIALVSQEVTLFNDTIRDNIAYGREGATADEIVAAAKNAGAHDFIESLPDGYDTQAGELGERLSGGQRQRISIARAMLKDAPILLLDEATSSLDTESERAVQEALDRLKKGRTTIVIAHRLSTVVGSDSIYVIERGRVVESGTHAELIAAGGAYARQYALQFVDIENAPEPELAAASDAAE